MVFNSIDFLVFFPIVLLVYFVIPKKIRYIWLLVAGYYFYMSWNPKYALLLVSSTLITYFGAVWIGKLSENANKKSEISRKLIAAGCFVTNLGILFFFKYFDFALFNINRVLGKIGVQMIEKPFDVVLPVGISFYTFQALGYVVDVYREEKKAETNFFKYALFVSFFPVLLSGPIERSKNLMKQIEQVHTFKLWNYGNITSGAAMMLWGYFLKMVVADRLAILVDHVFATYMYYGATVLIVAAVFFAFQIYCDFGSYSMLAMGCAKIMGFSLTENFNAPYFSKNIQEFWSRWHVSLSSWFKDYLYIPLGGNRKGTMRKYINLFITFLVSGLWHGASFSFVAWGAIHGIYRIVGDATKSFRGQCAKKFKVRTESFSHKLLQGSVTFILVDFAWIFFRSDSLHDSIAYITRIFTNIDPWSVVNGSLLTLELSGAELGIAVASLFVLIVVDFVRLKKGMLLYEYLNTQSLWFRWSVYILLVVSIFLFGIYGPGYNAAEFIYFRF